MRLLIRCLAAAALCATACSAQSPANAQPIFEFHSGFWLNLHQFLSQQAKASAADQSDPLEWRNAVDYYRRDVVPRGEMSLEMTEVNNQLSAAGSATDLLPAGLNPELASILAKAAPIYRRVWWPQHDRSNRAWIDAASALVAQHGAAIKKDLAAAYQVDWPAAPVRTDVSVYAGPLGAYTTTNPTPHITMSSMDKSYQGNASLEMLFHEISHALIEKVHSALAGELAVRAKLFRRRAFDHAIIFYTAGEVTRRYVPGYETYAVQNGIWENGWPGALPVLEKDWKPYLDGQIDFKVAVQAIVRDYGVPRNAP